MVETRTAIVTGGAGGIGKSTVRRLLDERPVGVRHRCRSGVARRHPGGIRHRIGPAGWLPRRHGRRAAGDAKRSIAPSSGSAASTRWCMSWAAPGPSAPATSRTSSSGNGPRHRSQPDERLSRRARGGAADAQAASRTDRAFFLDHRRRRERAADDGDRAAALRDGEGGAARLHRAACQGSGGVGHHGECADAGIDFRRAGHADSRQVRQSADRPAGGAVERLSRRTPGTGDEVAAAVEFLLSESAGFISGVALPVDGAYR